MKTSYLIILSFLGLSLTQMQLSAQEAGKKSQVELKDGSLLKGTIIEDTDYHIKLVIETGDTLTIGYKNIAGINQNRMRSNRPKATHDYDGLFVGVGFNQYIHNDAPFGFSLTVGKRLSKKTSVGVEARWRRHDEFVGAIYVTPDYGYLGAYMRQYLLEKRQRFFADATLGYTIGTNSGTECCTIRSDYKGGVQAALGGGVQFATTSPLSLIVKGGVTYSHTSGEIASIDIPDQTFISTYSKKYLIPYVGVGIEF